MTSSGFVRVAVVQRPPVLLDGPATMSRAVAYLHDAASAGAALIVFPEAYFPGYPVWMWRLRPGPDYGLTSEIHGLLGANSIDLVAGGLRPLQEAAAELGVVVVCGLHERDAEFSRATLYNTVVTIGPDGAIKNRHRKLIPTNPERMVWGQGDASGLRVISTDVGRLGALICWENYMPLARYALYAEGVEIYLAPTWDAGEKWIGTMRHIASEGRCWVIGAGCSLQVSDVPADFPSRAQLFPDESEWLNPGDSVIVAPNGDIAAGPLHEKHDLLIADLDLSRLAEAHRTLDVAGHYGRPDVFQLTINRAPARHITEGATPG